MLKHKLAAAFAVVALASPAVAWAEDEPLPVQIVDAMNKAFGTHPGFRANHAKGVVVEGSFKASPEAPALSKAKLFDGSTIPATVRFSDSTGVPNLPDGSALANPHGMAIKFLLPNGEEVDMVTNSLKFFPVSNGADFRDLFLAIAASPPDAPKPTKFEQFVAAHPTVAASAATVATPGSFAEEEYHGIDAFVPVNKSGDRQPVRYLIKPERVVHLDPADAAKRAPNFLLDELPERVKRTPVTFHLAVQLAAPSDSTKDPSQPWPDDRKVVDLGTLTIDKTVADSAAAEKPAHRRHRALRRSADRRARCRLSRIVLAPRASSPDEPTCPARSGRPDNRLRESRLGVQTCRLLPDFTSFIRATNCPHGWRRLHFPSNTTNLPPRQTNSAGVKP